MMRKIIIQLMKTILVKHNVEGLEEIGSIDKWNCILNRIHDTSVILSAGVGRDITFEHDLIKRKNCKIMLYDPSPTGIATMAEPMNQHENITFIAEGIAGEDGLIGFGKPDRENEGSWKIGNLQEDESFRCRSISSLMNLNDWHHIDLLKIDIEGFEFGVVDDILHNNLDVRQICVEFHHSKIIEIKQTALDIFIYMFRLKLAGYSLVKVVKADFTFVKRKLLY